MQDRVAKGGRIGRDYVEGHSGHRNHHRADDNESPVEREGAKNFRCGWAMLLGCELIRLLQGPSEPEQKRNNHAPEKQWHTPSPQAHFFWRKSGTQHNSNQGRKHNSYLLAARLPTYIETPVT